MVIPYGVVTIMCRGGELNERARREKRKANCAPGAGAGPLHFFFEFFVFCVHELDGRFSSACVPEHGASRLGGGVWEEVSDVSSFTSADVLKLHFGTRGRGSEEGRDNVGVGLLTSLVMYDRFFPRPFATLATASKDARARVRGERATNATCTHLKILQDAEPYEGRARGEVTYAKGKGREKLYNSYNAYGENREFPAF